MKIQLAGANGLQLTADVEGDPAAPPVLLFHGGGQTRHAWGTTLKVLGADWHAYSIDLRGHGESDWAPNGDYSIDAFAADVEVIARSMPTPPVLVGASLGGISSLTAIAETDGPPLARALVLVDVAPRIEVAGASRIIDFMKGNLEGFGSLEEVADVIAAYNPNRPRPKNLEGLKKNLRQRADGRWIWHWDPRFVSGDMGSPDETRLSPTDVSQLSNPEGNRLERAARKLTIPTLLVRGRMSDLLSEQGVKELKELVPHAQVADVAGAGHMVAGDRNDAFNGAIVDFLNGLRDGEV